jgi:hypothetical protein
MMGGGFGIPGGSSSHHSRKCLAEFEKRLILVIVVGM